MTTTSPADEPGGHPTDCGSSTCPTCRDPQRVRPGDPGWDTPCAACGGLGVVRATPTTEQARARAVAAVLTDPERAALDRLEEASARPLEDLPYIDRDAVRTLVAVVGRLAAAPAPEALVDAVEHPVSILAKQAVARAGWEGNTVMLLVAAEAVHVTLEAMGAEAARAVVGQAATHDAALPEETAPGLDSLKHDCPTCGAEPGFPCTVSRRNRRSRAPHHARRLAAQAAAQRGATS